MKLLSSFSTLGYLGAALIFSASAHAATIEVTTTTDEDVVNSSACSIREAVKTSLRQSNIGGCVRVGDTRVGVIDTINLKSGETYQLNSTIVLNKQLNSRVTSVRFGSDQQLDYSQRNTVTGLPGKIIINRPIIRAANNQSIFDSSQDRVGLEFTGIELRGSGFVDQGGAINVGGELTLTDSKVTKGYARFGGAFFLEGSESALQLTRTELSDNEATESGSAIGQSCFDNLTTDNRVILINQSSIVKNNGPSTIKLCGTPNATIENTTIAENKGGVAIDFEDVAQFSDGNNIVPPRLTLDYVTLSQNAIGISYGDIGVIDVDNSVVAYNLTRDCDYIGDNINDQGTLGVTNSFLIGEPKTSNTNPCELFQLTTTDENGNRVASDNTSNSYVATVSVFTDFFEGGLKDYGLASLGYLPKRFTPESPILIENQRNASCIGEDQRGLSRNLPVARFITPPGGFCYKGAINRANLIAVPDGPISNDNFTTIVQRLEGSLDRDPNDFEDLQDRDIVINGQKRDEAFLRAYTELLNENYRATFAQVLDNDVPYEGAEGDLPDIKLLPRLIAFENGDYVVDGAENYVIKAESIGSGSALSFTDDGALDLSDLDTNTDNFKCEYNQDLADVIAYREDGSTTPSGQFDFCEYTITLKSDDSISTTSYIAFEFINIAPNAEDLTIKTKGDEVAVNFSLLDSINDDGDGPNRPSFTTQVPQLDADGNPRFDSLGRPIFDTQTREIPEFYRSPTGVEGFVQVTQEPELGRLEFSSDPSFTTISAGIECPVANANQLGNAICYPPYVRYIRDNLLSNFTDSFQYVVYDGGALTNGQVVGSVASEPAEVTITAGKGNSNLVDATSVFSGGGYMAPWVLGFLSLLVFTRRSRHQIKKG